MMTNADVLIGITLILILLSSMHRSYGKNVPKLVWRLSIFFSVLAGMFFGIATFPFPESLGIGSALALSFVFINWITRISRNKHDT